MIICICNALNEKDLMKMTNKEYEAIKCCGICSEEAYKYLQMDVPANTDINEQLFFGFMNHE